MLGSVTRLPKRANLIEDCCLRSDGALRNLESDRSGRDIDHTSSDQEIFDRLPLKLSLSFSRQHAQNLVRPDRAVPPLEPVQSVLRVAEVPVDWPVAQLKHVLHRCASAAPPAP